MTSESPSHPPAAPLDLGTAFLLGGGEAGALMRRLDWSATPLGRPAEWPQALRTLVALMLGSAQPMFVAWGPARTMLYNDAYAPICGARHPAAMGAPFEAVWFDIMHQVGPILEQAFAGKATHMGDIAFTLHRNGFPEQANFAFSYTPVRGDGGQIDGVFCACIETTGQVMAERARRMAEARMRGLVESRRQAEEALRLREERLRLIMASIRDYAIFTTDTEDRIDTWLPGAEKVFGWSAAEAVGQSAAMIFTPEDLAAGAFEEETETARREGVAPDVRWHRRKDDSRVFIEGSVTALRDAGGGVQGLLKIGQDVTARREAEEGNARLAAIVTSTPDAIISFAAEDGRILSWNRGAEELFGFTEAEAVGAPVGLLVPPDQPEGDPTGVFRRAMNGERVHEYESVRLTKGGERVAVSITASRMLAADGRVLGVAGIFRDMRQRRAAEERQSLLAREVDHRAKNALAVVQSIVELTRDRDPEAFKRAIAGRIAALARAQTLLAEDRWSGADLQTLLRGELAPFLGERRAELDGPSVALPPSAAQPVAIAIHELATNALKYGALSAVSGHLAVSWRVPQGPDGAPWLQLRWVESGGPPITGLPTRRGFGSRVLGGILGGQLGGKASLAWESSGLVCEIEVPLRAEARSAGAFLTR